MQPRGQFTFYRSYFEALAELPEKERLKIYDAVCSYALNGTEPELKGVSKTVFTLIKPTLDTGSKRAKSGNKGGSSGKQTGSKQEANRKQSEREIEKEKEKEKEIENECYSAHACIAFSFSDFWASYPVNRGDRETAYSVWQALSPDEALATRIMSALEAFKQSRAWKESDGQFIPGAARFLSERRYEKPPELSCAVPTGAAGELGAAEMEAIQRVLREG